jgi:hypothetical protein
MLLKRARPCQHPARSATAATRPPRPSWSPPSFAAADPDVRERLSPFLAALGYGGLAVREVSVRLSRSTGVPVTIRGAAWGRRQTLTGDAVHLLMDGDWRRLAEALPGLAHGGTRWEATRE